MLAQTPKLSKKEERRQKEQPQVSCWMSRENLILTLWSITGVQGTFELRVC